jgi:hypothetical protein
MIFKCYAGMQASYKFNLLGAIVTDWLKNILGADKGLD